MKKNVISGLIKSHTLMLRAGMIQQLGPGLFNWLPLGIRVLDKVEQIVHKWHQIMGFNKCVAPNLHPAEFWHESGRYSAYGLETMRVLDRHKKELILGPTAEEVFAHMIRDHTNLCPLKLYNIQWKYRDEIRPRFGLMRSREFLMCDGYSFHIDSDELVIFYDKVLKYYCKMFQEIGFDAIPIEQLDTGPIGGGRSHEFFVITETAENEIKFQKNGQDIVARGIELGHIYNLGAQYSLPMKIYHRAEPLYMGCYGVGVTRLVASLVEIYGDIKGKIVWPSAVAPFKIHIIAIDSKIVEEIYLKINLLTAGDVLCDTSNKSFGEKMCIADLVGAPIRIIIMNRELKNNMILINNVAFSLNNDYLQYINEIIAKFAINNS